ncbi:MAG: tRNA (N6-isopentenyl adenosine(37)-C2)-methylthiotransferase MiaB [Desulfobulbaceae bacterium]|jgi:tRNA-2-methylthio-N6-dimethylallyladenosine synthase|nr:tRNA (N6-isopentenyl adenosine(37)-C2)-methylthiotransferase MiaB [Desulfobulbaceae bacterium]
MPRFYIKTFGCQMNARDSEIMAQFLRQAGHKECSSAAEADIILINTCSIRAKAEHKLISLLGALRPLKKEKPDIIIAVAGCVAQQYGAALREKMPIIDLIVGTQRIYQIAELLAAARRKPGLIAGTLDKSYQIPIFLPDAATRRRSGSVSRFVTIMQGCDNFCAYCVVPYTRGREVSRQLSDILEEVQALLDQGVAEITLLGQNVNSYGLTNSAGGRLCRFPELLRAVAALPGLRRLRFTTSHPKDLSDDLMRCFAELPNLCPHVHLPLQSGSDAVLKRMNRRYDRQDYLALVERLLQYRPDMALSTDIIVGFPGEDEADFAATMDMLERLRFDASFSFKYSDRPGTASANFPDKIDERIKGERLQVFQRRQDQISLERNRAYIGKRLEILLEQVDAVSCSGRTPSNHLTHINHLSARDIKPGDFVTVVITDAGQHALRGELAS